MTSDQKAAKLLLYYQSHPVEAIEQLFGVQLDAQQIELVTKAHKTDARVAVKSCQGAGKTATLVWLSLYYLLTLEDCRILIASPSAQQLHRVFHSELLKWQSKMAAPFKDFFEIMKETFYIKGKPYQMASLVTASVANQENLAGGHSKSYVVMVDEASGLEEKSFDTLLGTLGSSDNAKFILTSNPVRNAGRFYEIFARENERWDRLTFNAFDSAQCKGSWIKDIEAMYGKDDDNYKIRVLGDFGVMGQAQFFKADVVELAQRNTLEFSQYHNFAKVIGCDVARYGDDSTVLVLRQGPKLLDIREFKNLSTMEVAAKVVAMQNEHMAAQIYVDSIGVGAGVYDRLEELHLPVSEVIVSQKPTDPRRYANLRSQLYGNTNEWLENGADIPLSSELSSQLNGTVYTHNTKMQIQLMSKKDIKKSGLPSPDIVDALALTFADGAYGFQSAKTKPRKIVKRSYCYA